MLRSRISGSLTLAALSIVAATAHAQTTNTFPSSGNVGVGTTTPSERLTIQGFHHDTKILLFSDHYSQGINGANTALLTLWASEPGYTWGGVGIGNNVSTGLSRLTTTRGGSYARFLDNQIRFTTVDSQGVQREHAGIDNGTFWAANGANFYKSGGGNIQLYAEGGNSYNVINSLNSAGSGYLGLVARTPLLTLTGSADINGYARSLQNGVDARLHADFYGAAGIGSFSNHPVLWAVAGVERARFGTNGNLAVGTTNTNGARLDVQADGYAALRLFDGTGDTSTVDFRRSADNWYLGQLKVSHAGLYGANFSLKLHPNDSLMPTQPVEVMSVTSDGNLRSSGTLGAGGGVLDLPNTDASGGASDSSGIRSWNTLRLYSSCSGYTSNANYGIQFSPRDGGAVFKGNVGIGTANPTNKLEVNGTIRTKEVVVETVGWADHVLAKDYPLAPLSEVAAHIEAHGTLPGIPSAAQVAERGVSLGDMQVKLLAKLEELTLHQIAQEKRLDEQSARIAELERENTALRGQITRR